MKAAWLFFALIPLSCSQGVLSRSEPIDLCEFELVFSDEFDDLSVSPWQLEGKRWIAHTPWAGDFGDARFMDPRPDGPFTIENGKLVITASKNDEGKWESGLLAAADHTGAGTGVQYGYFEARMKMPPGSGTWPAFWLISLQPVATENPRVEIDVLEYYGHRDDSYQIAWHVWFKPPNEDRKRGGTELIEIEAGSLIDAYHDFGVEVTADHVTYYLDRRPVAQIPTPGELNTPLFPLVNLALGSGFSIENTPDPTKLYVDHVRIYQRVDKSDGQACQAAGASEN